MGDAFDLHSDRHEMWLHKLLTEVLVVRATINLAELSKLEVVEHIANHPTVSSGCRFTEMSFARAGDLLHLLIRTRHPDV